MGPHRPTWRPPGRPTGRIVAALLSLFLFCAVPGEGAACTPAQRPGYACQVASDGGAVVISYRLAGDVASFYVLGRTLDGWVALSFPAGRGVMAPADAVIASAADAAPYRVSGYSTANVRPDPAQALLNASVARDAAAGTTALAFSRRLANGGVQVSAYSRWPCLAWCAHFHAHYLRNIL